MRAVLVREFARDLTGVGFGEIAEPIPGPGEIAVAVEAASFNPVDLGIMSGTFHRQPLPFVPGNDFAGVVKASGPGANRFKPGDRVFGTLGSVLAGGTFAEVTTLPEWHALAIPDGLDTKSAGAAGMTFLTAIYGLYHRTRIREGTPLLVNGGSAGVGAAGIQVARRAGARIAATGNAAKLDWMRELGAGVALAYDDPDRAAALAAFAPDGFDAVLEMAYDANGAMDVELLRQGGEVVMIGSNDYRANPVNPLLALKKDITVHFTAVYNMTPAQMREAESIARDGFGNAGWRQDVDAGYPLERVAEALADFRRKGARKVVLTP